MATRGKRAARKGPAKVAKSATAVKVRVAGEPVKPIRMVASSGNVFEDLGLPDAAERLAKAELARVIRQIIAHRGWTQRRAADALDVAPPDVSDLMRGKLARFSQERLARFLNALDMDVRIQIRPRGPGKKRVGVTVEVVGVFSAR